KTVDFLRPFMHPLCVLQHVQYIKNIVNVSRDKIVFNIGYFCINCCYSYIGHNCVIELQNVERVFRMAWRGTMFTKISIYFQRKSGWNDV
ncbi:hypothetical protein, partial [Thermaerobacillus caldiproteolyticus]|uniref:hypothetical protein n=1 Tax=Thermaerobacillus caldiproteolyticus TaxID=247480 RepID=UPI001F484986